MKEKWRFILINIKRRKKKEIYEKTKQLVIFPLVNQCTTE